MPRPALERELRRLEDELLVLGSCERVISRVTGEMVEMDVEQDCN